MASRESGSSSLAIRVHNAHPDSTPISCGPGRWTSRSTRPGGLVYEKVPGRPPAARLDDLLAGHPAGGSA
jgi:hypothetical protein